MNYRAHNVVSMYITQWLRIVECYLPAHLYRHELIVYGRITGGYRKLHVVLLRTDEVKDIFGKKQENVNLYLRNSEENKLLPL